MDEEVFGGGRDGKRVVGLNGEVLNEGATGLPEIHLGDWGDPVGR